MRISSKATPDRPPKHEACLRRFEQQQWQQRESAVEELVKSLCARVLQDRIQVRIRPDDTPIPLCKIRRDPQDTGPMHHQVELLSLPESLPLLSLRLAIRECNVGAWPTGTV